MRILIRLLAIRLVERKGIQIIGVVVQVMADMVGTREAEEADSTEI